MNAKYAILGALFIIAGTDAKAQKTSVQRSQILNDSAQALYGPNTTRWISKKEMFFGNKDRYQFIDTVVTNYHYWTYMQRFNNFYKNLGNIGTAMYPIFPVLYSTIGVSTGFEAYHLYFETQEPIYYNTQSPYTRMKLVWGGRGRAMTNVRFSRNINPRWNFGFNFRALLVDKQIQRQRRGDRQTISYYYDLYTSYRTRNNRYQINFNFRRINHVVKENGGIINSFLEDNDYNALFNANNQPKLSTARSENLYHTAHVFQQYEWLPKRLQTYFQTDVRETITQYIDDNISGAPQFFYDPVINPSGQETTNEASDKIYFFDWTNKIGTKGHIERFFHDAYFKIRTYRFAYKYPIEDILSLPLKGEEYYFGGHAGYAFDSLIRVMAWADYLLESQYDVGISINSKWADAKLVQKTSKPPFIYNAYNGTFDFWNNRFKTRIALQAELFGKVHAFQNRFFASMGFTFTALQNHIYFLQGDFAESQQTVLPRQSDGRQMLLSPEIRFNVNFLRHFTFRVQALYTYLPINDDDVLRVPQLFINGQLAYENRWFKKQFPVHLGIDIHWKSNYFDAGYDPAIQQFYIQDAIITPAFPLLDIFFDGKIGRGRFFFRYHNLIQAFTQFGYLATPDYTGQRNILDFGFELLLFD